MIRAALIAAAVLVATMAFALPARAQTAGDAPEQRQRERIARVAKQYDQNFKCTGAPDDCTEGDKAITEPFASCHTAMVWLQHLLVRLTSQRNGTAGGLTPITNRGGACTGRTRDAECMVTKVAQRMVRFYRYGFDMKAGFAGTCKGGSTPGARCSGNGRPCPGKGTCKPDDVNHEDFTCSKCGGRGCPHSRSRNYAGPRVETAVLLLRELRREFGSGWDDPAFVAAFHALGEDGEHLYVAEENKAPIWFNQHMGSWIIELVIGEDLCDASIWDDGKGQVNALYQTLYTTGPREVAWHYGYHNFGFARHLLSLREPRFRAQWEAGLNFMAVYLSMLNGRKGVVAPFNGRATSGDVWCGKHCENDYYSQVTNLLDLDYPGAENEYEKNLNIVAGLHAHPRPYATPAPIRRLPSVGDVETWALADYHESVDSFPRMHWANDIAFPSSYPVQGYWTHDRLGVLSYAHGNTKGSQPTGARFGVNLYADLEPCLGPVNDHLLALHFQPYGVGYETDKGGKINQKHAPEDRIQNANDREAMFVAGTKGMGGAVLFEPRERPCQNNRGGYCKNPRRNGGADGKCATGSDCLARAIQQTYVYRPRAAVMKKCGDIEDLVGAYTCDGAPEIACSRNANGQDPVACAGTQTRTCNNWRVTRSGDNFYAVRPVGWVTTDDVVDRKRQYTKRGPGRECRIGDKQAPCSRQDVSGFYDRQVTRDGFPAGSLWWLADRQHFPSAGAFLRFLESRHIDFGTDAGNHTVALATGPAGYPFVELDTVRRDGSDMRMRLHFWNDMSKVHGERWVKVGAAYPAGPWAVVDLGEDEGEFSLDQGPLRAYHPGAAANPVVDWDPKTATLRVEGGYSVDMDALAFAPGAEPSCTSSPACPVCVP